MINPKTHEVVERVEKFAKDLGDEYEKRGWSDWAPPIASAASRAGAYFGIRLSLELLKEVEVALSWSQSRLSSYKNATNSDLNLAEMREDLADSYKKNAKAIETLHALKLLHVPSGGEK